MYLAYGQTALCLAWIWIIIHSVDYAFPAGLRLQCRSSIVMLARSVPALSKMAKEPVQQLHVRVQEMHHAYIKPDTSAHTSVPPVWRLSPSSASSSAPKCAK